MPGDQPTSMKLYISFALTTIAMATALHTTGPRTMFCNRYMCDSTGYIRARLLEDVGALTEAEENLLTKPSAAATTKANPATSPRSSVQPATTSSLLEQIGGSGGIHDLVPALAPATHMPGMSSSFSAITMAKITLAEKSSSSAASVTMSQPTQSSVKGGERTATHRSLSVSGTDIVSTASPLGTSLSPPALSTSTTLVSASPSTSQTTAPSVFYGVSKEWMVIGVTVIAFSSVAGILLAVVFFDHWWQFVCDLVCCGRQKYTGEEELIPDWEKRDWAVQVATSESHRYPSFTSLPSGQGWNRNRASRWTWTPQKAKKQSIMYPPVARHVEHPSSDLLNDVIPSYPPSVVSPAMKHIQAGEDHPSTPRYTTPYAV
jgi:hypothetical protein